MSKIRILIVDDYAPVREALAALLLTEPEVELVGEAGDGDEALSKVASLAPDVVLLDLVMPRQDGLHALKQIKQEHPRVQILILTDYADGENIQAAFAGGALGYFLKSGEPRALLQAIQQVHQGQLVGMLQSMDGGKARGQVRDEG